MAIEFFETKIRPVLVENCIKCHSEQAEKEKKLRGGLKLDTKAHWQAGGDTGPTIVPGKTGEGTLLSSLKYDGETKMPPKGKLPASVIADFEKWIKDGAVDPRVGKQEAKTTVGLDIAKGRQFWSLQPPKEQKIPDIRNPKITLKNPLDYFTHAKWDELKLQPNAAADKRSLIRRAYFDLIGLPPSPEQIESFQLNDSPDAFAKIVDKLLDSPQYGERWARHWLDVARYAEDQAHTFAVKPKTNAYLYRDWVIQAFNKDMPYDRFVRLQIAGDMIPNTVEEDPFTRLAGLGFLGLGADYYKNTAREQAIAEELDDRVDTLTRGFLGLTVSCARCHDHKFDPIPTRDYYSIAGIYYGTNLTDVPLAKPEVVKAYSDAQKLVKEQETAIDQVLSQAGLEAAKRTLPNIAKYLLAARKVRMERMPLDKVAQAEDLDKFFLDRWVKFLDPANAGKLPSPFKAWLELGKEVKAEEVASAADKLADAVSQIEPPANITRNPNGKGAAKAKGADALTKAVFLDANAPLLVAPAEAEKRYLSDAEKTKLVEMRLELENRKKKSPSAPLQAAVVSGNGQGMKVYIRGNHATKGEDAPKGCLQVLASPEIPQSKTDYSRLDLANAIASPTNPLTARVIVNRIWQGHFGRGLVNTPSNFGALGERPSHPELLDFLAVEFVKHGWSLKWLHRQIMLSSTYQLSSDANEANAKIDPASVYLWRGSRHRLDAEAWRDSLLWVSGNLDTNIGGPSFNLKDANSKRRTVYAKISRHELDGMLRLFDFPDANVTADKRTVTTVPQQQLFALNSEFMVNQAKAFANRVSKLGANDKERVVAAYKLAFGRLPEATETELAIEFLGTPVKPEDNLTRWQQYAQALLAANEFLYVD